MERTKFFYNMIALVITFSFMGTACGKLNKNGVSDNSAHNSSALESIEISEISTSDNSELVEYTERQIIAAICIELYGFNEKVALDHADYMMNIAETLSETSLGSIVSEEDAIQKAKFVLIETEGAEFIERIESDIVELNGEKIRYQRTNSPYNVTFYEEYDVWLIDPNLPSGITENGSPVMTPGMTPYVMLRGSDGKVLAVFH